MTWVCKENDPEQVLSGSIPSRWTSIPSFHGLRLRLPYRLFAVLVACVFQHCTRSLRSGAAEIAVELGDALGMWAGKADEDHTARVFCGPVHHAEHTRCLFRPV